MDDTRSRAESSNPAKYMGTFLFRNLTASKSWPFLSKPDQLTSSHAAPTLERRLFFVASCGQSECPCNPTLTVQSPFPLALHCALPNPNTCVEKVLILTADGRTLTGTLLSCDQLTNLVLGQTIERVIRPPDDPEPSAEVSHGLYLIRGENVAVCGLVDEDLDGQIDWARVRGSVVGGIKHV